MTSSKTSSAPFSRVHLRRADRNCGSAGTMPTRCGMGSTSTQAMSSALASRIAIAVSGSLKGMTTTSSIAPCGVPLATGLRAGCVGAPQFEGVEVWLTST